MKIFLILYLITFNVHAAKTLTIDPNKYAFNTTQPTVNLGNDEQKDHESDHDYCVRDNMINGYDQKDSEVWCQKRSWEK